VDDRIGRSCITVYRRPGTTTFTDIRARPGSVAASLPPLDGPPLYGPVKLHLSPEAWAGHGCPDRFHVYLEASDDLPPTEPLRASGGWCGPPDPHYNLPET
jgi:hypothetical protein